MKIKEPEFTYNSCSQLVGLKRKLIASIEKEEDVEVLLQYASVMKQKQVVSPKSDEVYFAKLEERDGCLKDISMPCCFTEEELDVVIKASEKSVIVSDEECFLEQMFRHAIKWNRTVYLQMVHIAVLV